MILENFILTKKNFLQVKKDYEPWTWKKLWEFFKDLLWFSGWFTLNHFLIHKFYAHSLQFNPKLVAKMSSWSLAGFTYYLCVFFNIKYLVLYGFPITFAKMEGYKPPNPPECCVVIYKFSDVWRYFDQGLYKFMIKHIYVPWIQGCNSTVRKLQATTLVFTFVYVWHGVNPQVR